MRDRFSVVMRLRPRIDYPAPPRLDPIPSPYPYPYRQPIPYSNARSRPGSIPVSTVGPYCWDTADVLPVPTPLPIPIPFLERAFRCPYPTKSSGPRTASRRWHDATRNLTVYGARLLAYAPLGYSGPTGERRASGRRRRRPH